MLEMGLCVPCGGHILDHPGHLDAVIDDYGRGILICEIFCGDVASDMPHDEILHPENMYYTICVS